MVTQLQCNIDTKYPRWYRFGSPKYVVGQITVSVPFFFQKGRSKLIHAGLSIAEKLSDEPLSKQWLRRRNTVEYCPPNKNHIFGSLSGISAAIATHMRDALSGTDLRPCAAKFQPNPFSNFEGDAFQTVRQTDRQTVQNGQTASNIRALRR